MSEKTQLLTLKQRNFYNRIMNLTYHSLRLLLKGIGKIPFGMLYLISDCLYGLIYHVVGYRKKVVRKNLTECFPEKSPEELKKIEKAFYRHFSDNLLETMKMGSMSDDEISRRMKFTNIGDINEVLRDGKSVALFLGHYGNWEWISSMPIHLYKGALSAQIYHKLSNPAVDRLMLESRASHGATNVEMHQTARFITRLASEGKECIVGFIADQSPRYKDIQLYVPFLNHKTPAQAATEKLARHYDMAPWFIKMHKVKRGYYEAEFVSMSEAPKTLHEYALTEMYYSMLEQMIRHDTSLYLWTHRRFKFAEILNE